MSVASDEEVVVETLGSIEIAPLDAPCISCGYEDNFKWAKNQACAGCGLAIGFDKWQAILRSRGLPLETRPVAPLHQFELL